MRIRRALFAIAVLSVATPAFAQEFPPFPTRYEERYPQDEAGLSSRSEAGDGLATVLLAERLQCVSGARACEERRTALYRRAREQGESMAAPLERIRVAKSDPSRASDYAIGETVCGRSAADVPAIIERVSRIDVPVRREAQSEWVRQEGDGDRGSHVIGMSRGPMSVSFFMRREQLVLVRQFINVLDIGSDEAAGERVLRASGEIAEAICPTWSGLGQATYDYEMGAVRSWPPRGIHVDGPSTWFAVMGVTPDVVWWDLYVEPAHNPFTSAYEERVTLRTQ